MQRRTVALFAVLALSLGAAACSKDSDDPTVPDVTTTTTAAAVSTTSTLPSGPAGTPDAAAEGLFNAWTKNDQDDASRYAKPGAISKMFAHPHTDDSVEYMKQGCSPQGGQFTCAWTYEGGAITMTVEAWPGGGYVVDSVTYIAD
jgi:hypothetical protein